MGDSWTPPVADSCLRQTLGVIELLAAAGLILPAVLHIAPAMVAVTAAAWILLMIGAMRTHLRLDQPKLALVNAIYLVLALFIVIGRLAIQPF